MKCDLIKAMAARAIILVCMLLVAACSISAQKNHDTINKASLNVILLMLKEHQAESGALPLRLEDLENWDGTKLAYRLPNGSLAEWFYSDDGLDVDGVADKALVLSPDSDSSSKFVLLETFQIKKLK